MKSMLVDEISVFFPCFNEEKNIENTVLKAIAVLNKIAGKWEIIIVNDGSKDNTAEVADKLKKKYTPNIKIVTHHPNRGYGAAF
jgi:glycosyltransferase involved in cell wall biosynthesis